ncbi:MAG: GNAT family N-acetyltransferase, partial [Acidobacteria bacterium]|nr:GNAT family N-acetyltransferase [Acidobacteriota bacterium]
IEFSNDLFLELANENLKSNPAPEVQISAIPPAESGLWTRTVCAGFAEHFPFTPEMLETMTSFALNPKSICFLARINGTPAGGGAVCIHEGVGVVNGASTLPEFRGRGVQRALLLTRLHYALEHGCDLAMTNTQPGSGSQRNVERLGFRVAYSRTKFFLP